MKRIILKALCFLRLSPFILYYHRDSYLKKYGWFVSLNRLRSVDKFGNPIPWWTYPFIDFIVNRIAPSFNVFEYGAGNSTLWLSNKVKSIISVENDKDWYVEITKKMPENAKIVLAENEKSYIECIDDYKNIDLVIIDGLYDRKKCFLQCINSLSQKGVIIWDNSDRLDFAESKDAIRERGFKEISFRGMCPSTFIKSQTSVLYKDDNVLNI